MMTTRNRWKVLATSGMLLALAGCGGGAGGSSGNSGNSDDYPGGPVALTAPTDPGSGFDLTLRTVAKVLQSEKLVDTPLTVQNRPGGLATTWESAMVDQHTGADDQISIQSLSTQLIDVEGRSEYTSDDFTMLATLMTEYFMVVTSPDAEFDDLDGAFEAMKKDPENFPIAAQLEDTLALVLMAEEAGVDPSKLTFVTYEGGGEQATAVLNGDVKLAVAGVSEFQGLVKSGDLKGLAVVTEQRLPGLDDVATSAEQGYETDLSNWRALYGPPDMPDYAVEFWVDTLKTMTESDEWAQVAADNNWTTAFRSGAELDTFLDESSQYVETALESYGQSLIPGD